jgi:hypothetical protein
MSRATPLFDWPVKRRPKGHTSPKPLGPKEVAIHGAIVDALRRFGKSDWAWSHFPAGELRGSATGAKLKRLGLQPGWPDLILVAPGGRFHALEIKRAGGVVSDDQQAFLIWCSANDVPNAIVRTVDEALDVLGRWGALRVSMGGRP